MNDLTTEELDEFERVLTLFRLHIMPGTDPSTLMRLLGGLYEAGRFAGMNNKVTTEETQALFVEGQDLMRQSLPMCCDADP